MNFEVSHNTLQNPSKTRNGDYCQHEFLENENVLLAVLCDGVGSNACDWRASKIGCEKFIVEFKSSKEENISLRFSKAIQKVNQELLLETGICEGMKSTFSAVAWEFNKSQIHYVSIGDSRIYEYQNEHLIQISQDETKSVILRKKDGKPMMISGVAVVAEGVTNVIGSEELAFEVFSKTDNKIKGIVLASDGFYNASNQFQNQMVEVFNALNIQNSLDQLQYTFKRNQKDDMTILAVRKVETSISSNDIINDILENKSISHWSDLNLSKAALNGIQDGIKKHKVEQVQHLIEFADDKEFDFGRKILSDLISLMAKENFQERDIYQMILGMMRRSKFV